MFDKMQPVAVKGIKGPCFYEGPGPMLDECSVLEGNVPKKRRHVVKVSEVKARKEAKDE